MKIVKLLQDVFDVPAGTECVLVAAPHEGTAILHVEPHPDPECDWSWIKVPVDCFEDTGKELQL